MPSEQAGHFRTIIDPLQTIDYGHKRANAYLILAQTIQNITTCSWCLRFRSSGLGQQEIPAALLADVLIGKTVMVSSPIPTMFFWYQCGTELVPY
jgi:hypothetical protein